MSFTVATHKTESTSMTDRPTDLYVTPEVIEVDGKPVMRIDVPLENVNDHIGITRDAKDPSKITGAGFAVKLNPTFKLSGNMPARTDTIAQRAGEKYKAGESLAVTVSPSSRGLWIRADLAKSVTPTR